MNWIDKLRNVVTMRSQDFHKLKSPDGQTLIQQSEMIKFHFGENVNEERVRSFLKTKSPNQSPEEFNYEVSNFQVTTQRIVMKLAGMFTKVISPANYSYELSIDYKYPLYGDLHNFYSTIYLNSCLIDPNGVRVTKPYKIPTTSEGNFDDSKEISAIDIIVPFERIITFSEDELVVISSEKITLDNGRFGLVVEEYTLDTYRKYIQVGKWSEFSFELEIEINHNAGIALWNKLGCDPFITDSGEMLYRSPLSYVLPDLNLYLKNDSNLFVSTQGRLFAERIEIGDQQCVKCNGSGFTIKDGQKHTCGHCDGTGVEPRLGKLSTKYINITAMNEENRKYMIDSIRYVAPPQAPLEFVDKFLKEKEAKIYEAMNLHLTSKENETATGKRIDRDEQHTLLQRFSDALYNSMELSIIGIYAYMNKEPEFVLTRPVTFDRKSEEDLLKELNESQGLNSTINANASIQFVQQRYGEESLVNEDIKLQIVADRLFNHKLEEKISLVGAGLAESWEVYLSTSFAYILSNLRDELKGKEIKEQVVILQTYARENAAKTNRGTDSIL
jgi:hypothetical protein